MRVISSIGDDNDMATVEPGASAATSRCVATIASLVRCKLTPVNATIVGAGASSPKPREPRQPGVVALSVPQELAHRLRIRPGALTTIRWPRRWAFVVGATVSLL